MPQRTIDRDDLIQIFHELMGSDSEFRILRLLGGPKLGKTHFLTKVFPLLARQAYGARCAVLDVRQGRGVMDVLHDICTFLGGATAFPRYFRAYYGWLNRPKVRVTGLSAVLSSIRIGTEGEREETGRILRYVLAEFVADLHALGDATALLIFDTVDGADETVRAWLMGTLLAHLASVPHARAIVGGRSVPEPTGSCVATCGTFELFPVEEVDAYVDFCHAIGADLPDQSVRDFARATDYRPGLFVDLVVPTFVTRR